MAKKSAKVPVKKGKGAAKAPAKASSAVQLWQPFETLRDEVDRLFEDFEQGIWPVPFRRSLLDIEPTLRRGLRWGAAPAVDIVEKDKAYEVTAELPGMEEKDIEVKVAEGGLTIRGEKKEEKEEKRKNYYLHERHFGAFERYFRIPEGVDADKIQAIFKKGVLSVTLPKTAKAGARKAEKKINVKTG